MFYKGLTPQVGNTIDVVGASTFLQRSADETWKIFETSTKNLLHQGISNRPMVIPPQGPKWGSVLDASHSSDMAKQIDELSKKLD